MKIKNAILGMLFIITMPIGSVYLQTQVGTDIIGENLNDEAGAAVALSANGNRVAIGAPRNINGRGHVRIYEWDGMNWNQLGEDIEGESSGDQFGGFISLSANGNRLAVGARLNDGSGADAGHARVFRWNGNSWNQMGEDIDGVTAGDESGRVSLSADGSRLAVGASWHNLASGHVRVLDWDGVIWDRISADIEGENGDFASRAALSGNGKLVVIGSRSHDGNGMDAGRVRVYRGSGRLWSQVGDDINGTSPQDQLGTSVTVSDDGNRMAVGAPSDFMGRGYVQAFHWNGSDWIQLGGNIDGEEEGDETGSVVSLSADGSWLAISAPRNASGRGQVQLFEWNGESWSQVGTNINGSQGEGGQGFGASMALAGNGNRVAIGVPSLGNGVVRVFDFSTVVANNDLELEEVIQVFPNPSSGYLHISGINRSHVKIIDNSGRIWWGGLNPESIDIHELPLGIYFISIYSANGLIVKKIVKN